MSNVSIVLSGATKHFAGGNRPAVSDISFDVASGEIVALLGPSGCGKTTTLRLIAGFERLDAGSITINGRVVDDGRKYVSPDKRSVGMVFQDFALFPHLTVAGNIGFGLVRTSKRERTARVAELAELTGLSDLLNRYPHQLSGGQQQRVALARALAPNPDVLLLDEPFSNLDTELRLQMRTEVREILKSVGTTAILVTHDQQEAMTVADRIAVMLDGQLEQIDAPEIVYHYPATRAVANFVGLGTFVPAQIAGEIANSDIGQFTVDGPPGPAQVDLLLRPRDVSLTVDPAGVAVVQSRVFHGAEFTYRVQLPCGVVLQSNQPSHVDIAPGTPVSVRCARVRLAAYNESSRIAVTTAAVFPTTLGADSPPTVASATAAS